MLTREERMKLHNVREDYLELFYTRAELRDEKLRRSLAVHSRSMGGG